MESSDSSFSNISLFSDFSIATQSVPMSLTPLSSNGFARLIAVCPPKDTIICDGKEVFVPGIMELVERTGVHSGDSICVYPTFSISDKVKKTILDYAKKLGIGIGIVGLFNIQFIVDKEQNVSIIEVNPRSSRTVPFLSKATGYPSLSSSASVTITVP